MELFGDFWPVRQMQELLDGAVFQRWHGQLNPAAVQADKIPAVHGNRKFTFVYLGI